VQVDQGKGDRDGQAHRSEQDGAGQSAPLGRGPDRLLDDPEVTLLVGAVIRFR
jgi:hypothetical protein